MAVTLVGSVGTGHNELAAAASSIAATRNGIVAGNTIVVAVQCADTFAISNVSDGTITNSTPDITFHWAGGTQNMALFSFRNHAGGNFTFTANFAGNTAFRCIDIIELTPSQFEGSASSSGSSASASSGNISPTPSVDGCYIVGFAGDAALTSAGGFADLFNDPTIVGTDLEGLAQASKAAIAATWTLTSGVWGAIAASYKPTAIAPVGFGGTRGPPGQGPRDRRGFLKARVWDYTLMAAGPQTYSDTVAEVLASADSETAQADFVSARADAGAAADSEIANVLFVSAETETLSAADTETGLAAFAGSATDGLAASDSETTLATFVSSITETLSAADSIAVLATFISAITETLSAADSETGLATFVSAIAESLSAADTEDATVTSGGTTYNDSVTEALSAADAEVATAAFASAGLDTIAVAEGVASTADFVAALTETLAVADSSTGTTAATFDVAVDEVLALSDTSATETAGLPRRAIYDETFDEVEPQIFNVHCEEQLEVTAEQLGRATFTDEQEESVTVGDERAATADFRGGTIEVLNAKAKDAGWAFFRAESSDSLDPTDESDADLDSPPPPPKPPQPEAELADDELLAIVAAYQMLEAA